jgi:hypothetical protein
MPELRASNESASHHGERQPRGRRQRISVPFLQTRLSYTRSRASERASREVNQLPGLAAGSLTEVGSMLRVSQPERDPMSSKFLVGQAVEYTPIGERTAGLYKIIRQMPAEHQATDVRYLVKSGAEAYERVVPENMLSSDVAPESEYHTTKPRHPRVSHRIFQNP